MYVQSHALLDILYTVNLHIERMNTGRYFSKNCVLLAIRPVKIAAKDVSEHFCKYEPAKMYVLIQYMCADIHAIFLYRLFKRRSESTHLPVKCAGVECVFEFIRYSYQGGQEILSYSRSPLSAAKLTNDQPPVPPPLSTKPLQSSLSRSPPRDVKDNRTKKTNHTAATSTQPTGHFDC